MDACDLVVIESSQKTPAVAEGAKAAIIDLIGGTMGRVNKQLCVCGCFVAYAKLHNSKLDLHVRWSSLRLRWTTAGYGESEDADISCNLLQGDVALREGNVCKGWD